MKTIIAWKEISFIPRCLYGQELGSSKRFLPKCSCINGFLGNLGARRKVFELHGKAGVDGRAGVGCGDESIC